MTKQNIITVITSIIVLSVLSVANPVLADESQVKPEKPVIAPQCWFICPPDQPADE